MIRIGLVYLSAMKVHHGTEVRNKS